MKDSLGTALGAQQPEQRLQFDETVQAVYAVLSQGVGKFDLQAGLRAEYATRLPARAAKSYPYNYASLFPSGVRDATT